MKNWKKYLSILLITTVVCTYVPLETFASDLSQETNNQQTNSTETSNNNSQRTATETPASEDNQQTEVKSITSSETANSETPSAGNPTETVNSEAETDITSASTENALSGSDTTTETTEISTEVVSTESETQSPEASTELSSEDSENNDVPQVIEVSDLASFTNALNAEKVDDNLTAAYSFTVDSSTAVVDGTTVALPDTAKDMGESVSVPTDIFVGDTDINQDAIQGGSVDVNTIADNSCLEVQKNGDTVDLVNPFQNERLIVTSEGGFDPYGATSIIQGYNNIYILTYATQEQTKAAYEMLKTVPGINVEPDGSMAISEERMSKVVSVETSLNSAVATMTDEMESNPLTDYIDSHATDTQINVAVIDTGINSVLPEFAERVIDKGYNFASSSQAGTIDENSHGTAVSYLIATNTKDNVKIVPYKVAGENGRATVSAIYAAIETAISSGEDVINISLNSAATEQSQLVTSALNDAYNCGITVVVSAGNAGGDVGFFSPSNVSSAIVVGSVDENKGKADFSNFGDTLDFVSDGTNLTVKDKNGNPQTTGGTSFSAAMITAAVAEIKSADKGQNADEINGILAGLAKDIGDTGWDKYYGNGYLSMTKLAVSTTYPNVIQDTSKETLLSNANWQSLSDEKLNNLFWVSNLYERAIFLAVNKKNLDKVFERIPAFKENIQVMMSDGSEFNGTIYDYLMSIDPAEYTEYQTSTDNMSSISGSFGANLSNANSDIGFSKAGYCTFIISASGYNDANETRTSTYQLSFQAYTANNNFNVGLMSQSGSPDYFNLTLEATTGVRQEGGGVEGLGSNGHCMTIYEVSMKYTEPAYHSASGRSISAISGKRMNTKKYQLDNQGDSTLDTSERVVANEDSIKFNVNVANTGQASYYDEGSSEWKNGCYEDGDTSKTFYNTPFHGTYQITCTPHSATVTSNDYKTNNTFIASSGAQKTITYPTKTAYGSDWGTASPLAGYKYSSSTSATYAADLSTSLAVARYFAPITYSVKYDSNGGTGTTGNSTHTYDTQSPLNANLFTYPLDVKYNLNPNESFISLSSTTSYTTKINRSFSSWNSNAAGTGTDYSDKQQVLNLTAIDGGTINLYAKWGNASGKTLAATDVYRRGYTLTGWTGSNGTTYTPEQTFNISAGITFTPVWSPNTYLITLNGQGKTSTKDSNLFYEKYDTGYYSNNSATQTFANNKISIPEKYVADSSLIGGTRKQQFLGYFTNTSGLGFQVIQNDGSLNASINGSSNYAYFDSNTTVYANWIPNYVIQYDRNLSDADLSVIGGAENCSLPTVKWKHAGEDITVSYEEAAVTNPNFEKIYRFLGWSLTPTISGASELVLSKVNTSYTFSKDEDITLYAQWDSSYNVAYIGNEQSEGKDYNETVSEVSGSYIFNPNDESEIKDLNKENVDYFIKTEEKSTIDPETGTSVDSEGNPVTETVKYSYQGWSMYDNKETQDSKKQYSREDGDTASNTIITDAETVTETDNRLGLTFGAPVENYGSFSADHSIGSVKLLSGLSIKKNEDNTVQASETESKVLLAAKAMDSEAAETPYANMFTIWDAYPQIQAANIYVPLQDAQDGTVSEEYLLSLASATDEELISPSNTDGHLNHGADSKNKTSFIVYDYSKEDFTGAIGPVAFTITYQATDSVGNITKKTVTVHIVDSKVQKYDSGSVRFISLKYLESLNENSIWRTSEYASELSETLNNKKTGEEYTKPSLAEQAMGSKSVEIPGSGTWTNEEETWVFEYDTLQQAKEYIQNKGLWNNLSDFYATYVSCKK